MQFTAPIRRNNFSQTRLGSVSPSASRFFHGNIAGRSSVRIGEGVGASFGVQTERTFTIIISRAFDNFKTNATSALTNFKTDVINNEIEGCC